MQDITVHAVVFCDVTASSNWWSGYATKTFLSCRNSDITATAVTRIRTWVVAATTRSTNHYTITAMWTGYRGLGKNFMALSVGMETYQL